MKSFKYVFNIIVNQSFGLLKATLGLLIFKIKYPKTLWVRPLKIGTFYSQGGQDFFLSSLLHGVISRTQSEKSWVVDVGCNHPVVYNNSFFFEKYFSCKVLAIDPIQEFEEKWLIIRPRAIFYNSAVGDIDGEIKLHLPSINSEDNMFSFVDSGVDKRNGKNFIERVVPLTRLQNLFIKYAIKEILFLSIDVEGFELNTLKGINFDDVVIRCLLIENNSLSLYGSDEIRDFLKEKNYIFYARIGHLDDVFIHESMIRGI